MSLKDFVTSCFVQAVVCHMLGDEETAKKLLNEAIWGAHLPTFSLSAVDA